MLAKHRVLGVPRARGISSMGDFDHKTGAGHVKRHRGDYFDAIENRKAIVHLLVHETLGGMSPYAARRLRRLARDAIADDTDATDYERGGKSARSFVPFYSQRISNACVINQRCRGHPRGNPQTEP